MTSPLERLAELATEINATEAQERAGDLLREARQLVVEVGIGWAAWIKTNMRRSERRCQLLLAEAKERAGVQQRKGLITPVDLLLAEQLAKGDVTPQGDVEAEPHVTRSVDKPADPDVTPQEGVPEGATEPVPDSDVAAGGGDDNTDGADAPSPLGGIDANVATDMAEPEPAAENAAEPAAGEEDPEPATAPEPIPRIARVLADLWLALPAARLRQECLTLVERQMVETGFFIADLQARAATLDFRYEAAFYCTPEARQAFAAWARSLPEPQKKRAPEGAP